MLIKQISLTASPACFISWCRSEFLTYIIFILCKVLLLTFISGWICCCWIPSGFIFVVIICLRAFFFYFQWIYNSRLVFFSFISVFYIFDFIRFLLACVWQDAWCNSCLCSSNGTLVLTGSCKIFPLLWFSALSVQYASVYLFIFIYHVLDSLDSWICDLLSFINFGKFLSIMTSKISSPLFSYCSPFGISLDHLLHPLKLSHRSWVFSSAFYIFWFSLFPSDWNVSIDIDSVTDSFLSHVHSTNEFIKGIFHLCYGEFFFNIKTRTLEFNHII